MVQALIQLWTGPIPPEHIWIAPANRPPPNKALRVYFRKWLVHPLKRRLAKYYLAFLKTFFGLKVVGITGSAGKTTTTEMLKAILSLQGQTVASRLSIDPIYNIPTTILKCTPQTKFLILEMGIEYLGEMDFYIWLAPPDIAIITNVNLTHTEFLKDVATIVSEKAKIGKFAHDLVISSDSNIRTDTSGKVHIVKPGKYHLQLLGNHLQLNASQAAKTAEILGVPQTKITAGLENMTAPEHRLQIISTSKHTLIDDTYNANPVATKAAIDTLVDYAKTHKKIPVMVFGQMNELGEFEKSAHEEIGQYIAQNGIEHLFTIGGATKDLGHHFESQDKLYEALQKFLSPEFVILIKGSRSWKLENLVARITASV